jgi:arginine decarboxylase
MSGTTVALPPEMAAAFPILVIAELATGSAEARSAQAIGDRLRARELQIITATSLSDGETAVASDAGFSCVVLSWGLCAADLDQGLRVIDLVRRRTAGLPILLAMTREDRSRVPLAYIENMDGFIWLPEDSPDFIAGRIQAAAKRYLDSVLPPFFGAMVNFADTHEYSWHTPGHTGGTAFMKTAVGRTFLQFYGEQMLRSDLSISVGELGSLNDHSGPCRAAEEHAARVFGADYTYFSIGGSSASNQIILQSAVTDGDVVLVDRNCHKSLNYALNQSGAIPVYLMPRRNARGLIGPVPKSEMSPRAVKQKLADSAIVTDKSLRPVMAALTNSTYDGLCYNVRTTTSELSKSVDRIHYDEAWYAYARFNAIYEGRYGMHRGERHKDDATVTVTHSTHKLLAALSQASMIHIRTGKVPVEPALFNEAFMMHTSTSPQYSIIASTDVSAKMMADAGDYLTDECLVEAIAFRQAMARLHKEIIGRSKRDWWFGVWQPDQVGGKPFMDADPDLLRTSSDAWVLKPNAAWHGFGDLGEDYCMLDPIKVTVLTPGLGRDGKMEDKGIPAPLVSSFLSSRGIVAEKTEPYSILVLFSVGITKGKWGSLVAGLMEFKRAYDANAPLAQVLPGLVGAYSDTYGEMGLKDLADAMHGAMRKTRILECMDEAFTILPDAVMNPHATYGQLVKRNVEKVPVAEMLDRVVAVQLVPYPPGIPIMMPGEKVSKNKRAVVDYLLALQVFDSQFPGFEHDTHGVEIERDADGQPVYMTYCLKK